MAQGQEMDGVVEGVPVKLAGCDNVEGGDDNDDIGDSVCCVPCPSSLNVSSRFSLSFSFFPRRRFLPPCFRVSASRFRRQKRGCVKNLPFPYS